MPKTNVPTKSKSPARMRIAQSPQRLDNEALAAPTTRHPPSQPKGDASKKTKPAAGRNASSSTKQDQVVAMLRAKGGTTIAAIMKVTGWQKHSVHGFFAGVVRKKLKLNLVSEKVDGIRTYSVDKDQRAKSKDAGSDAGRGRTAHGKRTRRSR